MSTRETPTSANSGGRRPAALLFERLPLPELVWPSPDLTRRRRSLAERSGAATDRASGQVFLAAAAKPAGSGAAIAGETHNASRFDAGRLELRQIARMLAGEAESVDGRQPA